MNWECIPKSINKPICKSCNGEKLSITKGRDGEAYRFVCEHSEWLCVAEENWMDVPFLTKTIKEKK